MDYTFTPLPSVQEVHKKNTHLALQPQCLGCKKVWMDFTGSFPTSSSGKGFSASVSLKQIFTFHRWNFLMLLFSRASWPTLRSCITSLKISCAFSWKKNEPKQKLQRCTAGSFLYQIPSIDLEVPGFKDWDYWSHPWVCRLHKSQQQRKILRF